MNGKELKAKLNESGLSLAEIARRLEVTPQSVSQFFKADDVRTGLLEDLCRVLDKDMSFFYDIESRSRLESRNEDAQPQQGQDVPYFLYKDLQDRYEAVVRENGYLRSRLSESESNPEKKKAANS